MENDGKNNENLIIENKENEIQENNEIEENLENNANDEKKSNDLIKENEIKENELKIHTKTKKNNTNSPYKTNNYLSPTSKVTSHYPKDTSPKNKEYFLI